MKTLLKLLALSICPVAAAATVEFTDGRLYEYKLLAEDRSGYVMRIDGMEVQIPRDMVARFHDAPKNKLLQEQRPIEAGERSVRSTGRPLVRIEAFRREPRPADAPVPVTAERELPPATDTVRLQVRMPLPEEPAQLAHLQAAVDNLRLEAAAQRAGAQEALTLAGDEGLAVLATYGLYHDVPSVRTKAAEILAAAGGRRVLKPLVEAFYAAAVPTIPPYQIDYVQMLQRQISLLTGKTYYFYVRRSSLGPAVADQMVAWWEQNFDHLPQQLGEPKLDPADPNYLKNLRALRTLNLQKLNFTGTILPPDVTLPPRPNTASEELQRRFIPTLPRDLDAIHHGSSSSLTPFVPKDPSPDRDAPGEFRTQLYLEKLAEEARTRQQTAR